MKEKILELKNKSIERANYYSNIGFSNLAEEYKDFLNILNELEDIVRERDALKQEKEEKLLAAIAAKD